MVWWKCVLVCECERVCVRWWSLFNQSFDNHFVISNLLCHQNFWINKCQTNRTNTYKYIYYYKYVEKSHLEGGKTKKNISKYIYVNVFFTFMIKFSVFNSFLRFFFVFFLLFLPIALLQIIIIIIHKRLFFPKSI